MLRHYFMEMMVLALLSFFAGAIASGKAVEISLEKKYARCLR